MRRRTTARANIARRAPAASAFLLAVVAASALQSDAGAQTRPLAVEIVEPVLGAMLGGRVEIRARVDEAHAADVLFVEFEVDGRVLFADARAPYELIWHAGEVAGHEIVARAYSSSGEVAEHRVATIAPSQIADSRTFASRVDRVTVFVRLEGRDSPRGDLLPGDFELYEDDALQSVLAVDRVESLPVAVGFMVDASGSMVANLGVALESASSFIEGMVRLPQDKAFVMAFADLPSMLQEFTNDVDRLAGSLDLISRGRYTRLYDSIVVAASQFEGHAGRRAMVLLTDGHDANSDAELEEAIRAAQRADVAIYPVAVNLGTRFFRERWVLERLARATGGRVWDLRRLDDPRPIYEGIAADLRAQYRITYRPVLAGGDGQWRQIAVRLADAERYGRARVRARPGYFAQ